MHTPLNLQGKEGTGNETENQVKEKKDQRSCRASKEGGRGELPKDDRGRQVSGETKESQLRDLGDCSEGATEQRPKGPTQQRREGPRGSQRERQAQEPKGSKGTDTEERVQGDQASKAKSKGRTDQDRRLLKHYQRPIQGAKV